MKLNKLKDECLGGTCISEKKCIQLILEKFPGFEDVWKEHLNWWGEEEPGLSNNMAVFSRYTISLLQEGKVNSELKEIFVLIETFMTEGTNEVQDAAATCFLENLINVTSWKRIPSSSFVHLLGNESKIFCKAWDEFTGVKTRGLWPDEK